MFSSRLRIVIFTFVVTTTVMVCARSRAETQESFVPGTETYQAAVRLLKYPHADFQKEFLLQLERSRKLGHWKNAKYRVRTLLPTDPYLAAFDKLELNSLADQLI